MSKFVLIDHSLTSIGGHHHEYAAQMIQTASRLGYQAHLACGAEFPEQLSDQFADPGTGRDCQIHRLFPYPSYGKWGRLYDGRWQLRELDKQGRPSGAKSKLTDWCSRDQFGLRTAKQRWRRGQRQRQFVEACRQLFDTIPLQLGDQVYLPTVSDFDLTCLAAYLKSTMASAKRASWHAQMHLSFWDGRQCDADRCRGRIEYMRECIGDLQQASAEIDLHLYTTTDELAEHYNALGVGEFTCLPYPAGQEEETQTTAFKSPPPEGPLRIVVAGKPREEKGTHHLKAIVESLWDDYFATGRLQLLVQTDTVGRLTPNRGRRSRQLIPPVVAVDYPLAASDYAALIQSADMGLFLYDAEEYYVRASGVLVEMLAKGKPVIAPSVCWLSQQTMSQEQSRLNQLKGELRPDPPELSWTMHITEGQAVIRETALPTMCDNILWQVRWASDIRACVRIEVQTKTEFGGWEDNSVFVAEPSVERVDEMCVTSLPPSKSIRPMPADARTTFSALTTGHSGVKRVRVRAFNAFDARPVAIHLSAIAFENPDEASIPLGELSLASADWAAVPRLVADMVEHYESYRRSALAFSSRWAEQHSPARTIEILRRQAGETETTAVRAA